MHILHINHSDCIGGAARAAYRIHHAVREHGMNSSMLVNVATTDDWTVQGPHDNLEKLASEFRARLAGKLRFVLRTDNSALHSSAIFPSHLARYIDGSDTDIVHLHWLGGETLSISDIGRIEKPVVWTLQDMWGFCGAEHYTEEFRWREGYRSDNRPTYEARFDINRWTWKRKSKFWTRPMNIVAPSNWLADCARTSILMRDWPVTMIPNCLNTDNWKPIKKVLARELLGLPVDVPLVLFGAIGGGQDPRKGFDLLKAALDHLRGERLGLELVVFGQLLPENPPDLGFPIHYTGHLHDDLSLRALYSAADVMVVPSRQEAFGQTASEAQACGTPVVAFDIGGLRDIVGHRCTGYLAQAFDTEDLAAGIKWVFKEVSSQALSVRARERAVSLFSSAVVAEQYHAIYAKLI